MTYRNESQITSGLIVEAEAYLGEEDSTAHAYKGHRSLANEALYADPGTIYIYSLYGHLMINLVTQKKRCAPGNFIARFAANTMLHC